MCSVHILQDCLWHMQRFAVCDGVQQVDLLFCHVAKSNVLTLSSHQAEQQASVSTYACSLHGCISMNTQNTFANSCLCSTTAGNGAGKLMFLHTNMSPKWNLAIPADFSFYSRRWQVSLWQT